VASGCNQPCCHCSYVWTDRWDKRLFRSISTLLSYSDRERRANNDIINGSSYVVFWSNYSSELVAVRKNRLLLKFNLLDNLLCTVCQSVVACLHVYAVQPEYVFHDSNPVA